MMLLLNPQLLLSMRQSPKVEIFFRCNYLGRLLCEANGPQIVSVQIK